MKRIIYLAIVTALLSLPLAAQTSDGDASENNQEQEQEEKEQEFIMAMLSADLQFNPIQSFTSTESQIYTALFEGLVSYNPLTLRPQPGVARRWESSPDGRVYTFYLRENARYWNGDQVTAQHFKDTWLAALDPEEDTAYSFLFDVIEGAEAYRTGETENPESVGIEVLAEDTLQVTLAHPATHFVSVLAHHSFVPLHPDMNVNETVTDISRVMGNGPYVISNASDSELTLRRNDLYWDRPNVEIPIIRIRMSDNYQGITERFVSGDVDWVSSGIALDRIDTPEQIVINPMFATRYFYIRAAEGPLSNPSVRRALALLVPWQEVRSDQHHYLPAATLVPSVPGYPDVEGISERSIAEAESLLEEAGYPQGDGLPEIVMRLPESSRDNREATMILEALREQLETEVTMDPVPFERYYESLEDDDYTIGTLSWIGDFADPLTFLQMWTSGSNLNDAGFRDATYDELIRTSMGQTGRERYDTLAEAETLLLNDAVVLPISHSPALNLIDTEQISGWYPNPLDIHPFKHLGFRTPEPPPNTAGHLYAVPAAQR